MRHLIFNQKTNGFASAFKRVGRRVLIDEAEFFRLCRKAKPRGQVMNALIFPRADTLTGRALALMLQGQKITHRDFQNHSASYRLSSPIEVLRNRQGWLIADEWLDGPTTDKTGRRAKF
ncbi:hypothetical protein [Methylocucumis oryzae]|uniref:Uncharacterized protein n=1 Tax=Methylocucumis oryzae TaxID=1632867 RepID=A0A0F3IEJ5_9GAMM|nr:hypothetical protein [Methylocucumis oryzae]KJV05171.1 hypothetical protein VZ94_20160 [Methylocucumis oryzae]